MWRGILRAGVMSVVSVNVWHMVSGEEEGGFVVGVGRGIGKGD